MNTVGDAGVLSTIGRGTTQKFAGVAALEAAIAATVATRYQLWIAPPAIAAGTTITFHLFVPTGAAIDWVQPYVQEGAASAPPYHWTGAYTVATGITFGGWTTLTVLVPTPVAPLFSLGVEFHTSGAWTGSVYVDSINW